MRRLSFTICFALASGCGGSSPPTQNPAQLPGGAAPPTGPVDLSGPDDSPSQPTGPVSDYTGGRYRVTVLSIDSGSSNARDLDGDQIGDNLLPNLLNTVDAFLPGDLDVTGVNENLEDMLDTETEVVFLDVTSDGTDVTIAVLKGLQVDGNWQPSPDAYTPSGQPKYTFDGQMVNATELSAGSGTLGLPVQIDAESPSLDFESLLTYFDLTVGPDGIEGYLSCAFSVDQVTDDVIAPLVDAFGDTDGPDYTALASSTLNTLADQDVDGVTAISGVFYLQAEPATW